MKRSNVKKSTLTYTLLFLLVFMLTLIKPVLGEEKPPNPGDGRQDKENKYVVN